MAHYCTLTPGQAKQSISVISTSSYVSSLHSRIQCTIKWDYYSSHFKDWRDHSQLNTAALSLNTEMTSPCCTLMTSHRTTGRAASIVLWNSDGVTRCPYCATLLPLQLWRRKGPLTAPHCCQQKRAPFTAQDRQGIQLASFERQLISLYFILESNAQ